MTVHGAAGVRFVPADPEVALAADGFVLCPSGAEWRKNLERLLLAWAAVPAPTRSAHPLVVQCHMDPDTRAAWERRRDELGLSATVRFTSAPAASRLVTMGNWLALTCSGVSPRPRAGIGVFRLATHCR